MCRFGLYQSHVAFTRAAFGKDDGKYDPSMSGGKHIKELRPPVRLRSKSAISENELPSNDGLNALLPVKMERSKTNSMPSEGSDLGGSPPLNYSPHELVVPLSLGGVRSSPGQKEMASIRKKLFTSSSQDASGQGGAFLSSATAPAAMLRANIPPRHNGGQSSAPSSLSLTAPDGLSVITSPAPGIVLDGVLANESRTKSEGGRDRGVRSNGKVSQEKKSLQGVKRPPLSKEKIINKSSRDNDLSLLDLSGEESMASSPPSVNTSRPRRQSKAGRTVEPIQKRPVLDKKSLTKPDGPDFSEGSFPSKQVHLVPVKPMPDPLSHSAGPSISRECSLDDMPSSAAQEDQANSVPAKTSPGDNKVKVSAMRMEAVIPENKSHVLAKEDKIQKPMSLSPPMQSQPQSSILDFNLSYSESESGGALSSSLGGRSAGPDSPPKSYSENDNILLQRIQEAQALNRKEIDDGAVMHKFSLWSNVDPSHFRPAHVMAPSDEIVAPDKKPAKVRGPRAAIKSDGDAIMCFDDSPEEADPVRLSSSTAASAISSSGNITVFKTRDVFAVDSAELDSSLIRADRVQIGAALGASGAMAMALRNMVDSTKMPPSPYVQNADEEEFSYLNTCGSVDSLDEMDGDVDFMSSIDETEMLSRATSVEVDGEDYQLHDSEEEDNNERKGYKYSVTPKRNVGSEGPSVVMVSSADTTVHVLKGKTNILNVDLSATLQKSEENGESIISSVNSALDTERKVRESDTNATYITPPREANPIRMEYDSANVFVHHSQPASARRISGDSNSSMQFRNVQGMSLDQMKMIGADKSYSMGNSSIISDDGCGFDADNNDIVHNGSDDRSVDFTLRERRRHNQHRMSHGHVNETENRISSANSATRAGRKQGGKQAIPWVRGEPIGQGTFGRVYRGMNEGTGELLAVKQITLVDGADGEVHSLRGEIRLMKSLNHTNIVR